MWACLRMPKTEILGHDSAIDRIQPNRIRADGTSRLSGRSGAGRTINPRAARIAALQATLERHRYIPNSAASTLVVRVAATEGCGSRQTLFGSAGAADRLWY